MQNGLSTGEGERRVEAFDERGVAAAGEDRAEFGDAEVTIHFGVTAAGHVEGEVLGRLFEDLHGEGAVLLPGGHGFG